MAPLYQFPMQFQIPLIFMFFHRHKTCHLFKTLQEFVMKKVQELQMYIVKLIFSLFLVKIQLRSPFFIGLFYDHVPFFSVKFFMGSVRSARPPPPPPLSLVMLPDGIRFYGDFHCQSVENLFLVYVGFWMVDLT